MCKINGKKLEEIRVNAGLSQKALGKEIGVSGQTISMYEKGNTNPSDDKVERICAILKISKGDIEIQDIGYNFKTRESKTVARVRKQKGFKRVLTPIETERWIAKYRNTEVEEMEVMNALNNPVQFAHKTYITIDPTFVHVPDWQRDTDMAKVAEIEENYSESKFDPIKVYVVEGKNELICADGVHRDVAKVKTNNALIKEGKPIDKILAEVIDCTEFEAIRIFLGQQSGRKTMTTNDTYRAAVKAGEPEYMAFKTIFERNRIQISAELTEIENPLGVVRPSSNILRLSSNKEKILTKTLELIKDLDWCGSTANSAYTLRIINVLVKLMTVYGCDVRWKLVEKCKGVIYFESKVVPIKSNAELYDFLVEEINK